MKRFLMSVLFLSSLMLVACNSEEVTKYEGEIEGTEGEVELTHQDEEVSLMTMNVTEELPEVPTEAEQEVIREQIDEELENYKGITSDIEFDEEKMSLTMKFNLEEMDKEDYKEDNIFGIGFMDDLDTDLDAMKEELERMGLEEVE